MEAALIALGIEKEDSARYASNFATHGYKTFSQVADNSSDADLIELGVDKKFHRQLILKASSKQPPVAATAVPFQAPQPQSSRPIVIMNSNPGMYVYAWTKLMKYYKLQSTIFTRQEREMLGNVAQMV